MQFHLLFLCMNDVWMIAWTTQMKHSTLKFKKYFFVLKVFHWKNIFPRYQNTFCKSTKCPISKSFYWRRSRTLWKRLVWIFQFFCSSQIFITNSSWITWFYLLINSAICIGISYSQHFIFFFIYHTFWWAKYTLFQAEKTLENFNEIKTAYFWFANSSILFHKSFDSSPWINDWATKSLHKFISFYYWQISLCKSLSLHYD